MRGEQENFVRDDELLRAWELFTPVLHRAERDRVKPLSYQRGSTGPAERQDFLQATGVAQAWLPPAAAL